jgi:hypothetical protein
MKKIKYDIKIEKTYNPARFFVNNVTSDEEKGDHTK